MELVAFCIEIFYSNYQDNLKKVCYNIIVKLYCIGMRDIMNADKIRSLTDALEYIEANLSGEISQEDCAKTACCSLSGLQKMFRYVFHIGVGDYITRRRLSKAAEELRQGEKTVLEIAVSYGYGSSEAFTRAFSRLWGVTPTAYRKEWSFSTLYPRLDFPRRFMYNGEEIMTNKFDISELYDYISSKKGTYILCFDTSRLMEVNNNYGRAAGDKVILECLHRIDEQCTGDMVMFRIGGDEFVMVTGLSERADVQALADKIISQNNKPITHEGIEIPVSMRAGAVLLDKTPRYQELFSRLVAAASNEPGKLAFEE